MSIFSLHFCNEMFIYLFIYLLFVLFQFWNSSQRNGWRLQSFGDVRFSRWNRFLKQNQPFNSRPHTYFQSRSQCNCQRMKLNLQLFEGNPQWLLLYFTLSVHRVPGQFFSLLISWKKYYWIFGSSMTLDSFNFNEINRWRDNAVQYCSVAHNNKDFFLWKQEAIKHNF